MWYKAGDGDVISDHNLSGKLYKTKGVFDQDTFPFQQPECR